MHIQNLQFYSSCAVAAITLCLLTGFAQTAAAESSSAFDISAHFTSDGVMTGLGPVNPVSGRGSPNYSRSSTIGPYQKVVLITEGTGPVPAFSVYGQTLKSHVAGGFGVDTVSAEGDTLTSSLAASLNLYPPPPTSPVPQPSLQIISSKVQSSANYDQTLPMPATVSASATFTNLAISGSLVGNQTLKFSGTPPNNTVLYKSPSVTITLNRKIVAGVISCTPKCTFTPSVVFGTAIDVLLTNANVWGHPVSGEISIGVDEAGSGSSPSGVSSVFGQ